MQKDDVYTRLPKSVAGCKGFIDGIDETEVDHLNARLAETIRNEPRVAFQAFFQSGELVPIRVETDSEKPDA